MQPHNPAETRATRDAYLPLRPLLCWSSLIHVHYRRPPHSRPGANVSGMDSLPRSTLLLLTLPSVRSSKSQGFSMNEHLSEAPEQDPSLLGNLGAGGGMYVRVRNTMMYIVQGPVGHQRSTRLSIVLSLLGHYSIDRPEVLNRVSQTPSSRSAAPIGNDEKNFQSFNPSPTRP